MLQAAIPQYLVTVMISEIESDRQLTELLVRPTEKIPLVSAAVVTAAWKLVGEIAIATIDQANQLVM